MRFWRPGDALLAFAVILLALALVLALASMAGLI